MCGTSVALLFILRHYTVFMAFLRSDVNHFNWHFVLFCLVMPFAHPLIFKGRVLCPAISV